MLLLSSPSSLLPLQCSSPCSPTTISRGVTWPCGVAPVVFVRALNRRSDGLRMLLLEIWSTPGVRPDHRRWESPGEAQSPRSAGNAGGDPARGFCAFACFRRGWMGGDLNFCARGYPHPLPLLLAVPCPGHGGLREPPRVLPSAGEGAGGGAGSARGGAGCAGPGSTARGVRGPCRCGSFKVSRGGTRPAAAAAARAGGGGGREGEGETRGGGERLDVTPESSGAAGSAPPDSCTPAPAAGQGEEPLLLLLPLLLPQPPHRGRAVGVGGSGALARGSFARPLSLFPFPFFFPSIASLVPSFGAGAGASAGFPRAGAGAAAMLGWARGCRRGSPARRPS